ncbi:hypothetical protein BC829DRAFT_174155 [Chytridium lagenaria]|nr:hypothetical protein BC829DRAFT_174155 [Chytridium lagenaria]
MEMSNFDGWIKTRDTRMHCLFQHKSSFTLNAPSSKSHRMNMTVQDPQKRLRSLGSLVVSSKKNKMHPQAIKLKSIIHEYYSGLSRASATEQKRLSVEIKSYDNVDRLSQLPVEVASGIAVYLHPYQVRDLRSLNRHFRNSWVFDNLAFGCANVMNLHLGGYSGSLCVNDKTGYVGDLRTLNPDWLTPIIFAAYLLVISPITRNLRTRADICCFGSAVYIFEATFGTRHQMFSWDLCENHRARLRDALKMLFATPSNGLAKFSIEPLDILLYLELGSLRLLKMALERCEFQNQMEDVEDLHYAFFISTVANCPIEMVRLIAHHPRVKLDHHLGSYHILENAARDKRVDLIDVILEDKRVHPGYDQNRLFRFLLNQNGDYEIFKRLLEDPRVDPRDCPPQAHLLVLACMYSRTDIVKLLLAHPRVLVEGFSTDIMTVTKDVKVMKLLLEDGRFNVIPEPVPAIIYYSNLGNFKIVQQLLKDPRVDPSIMRNRSLGEAVANDRKDVVKLLLNDPRVDEVGFDNMGLFGVQSPDVLRCLLERKEVDPSFYANALLIKLIFKWDGPVDIGETVVSTVSPEEHPPAYRQVFDSSSNIPTPTMQMIDMLLSHPRFDASKPEDIPIIISVKLGITHIVKQLLHKPRVNPCIGENIPLRSACAIRSISIIKLLLSDPRINPSYMNNDALHIACIPPVDIEIVKLFLRHPQIDPSDDDSVLLRDACGRGETHLALVLLAEGRSDPTVRHQEALVMASAEGHYRIVEMLLRHPKIDATANFNEAFVSAARRGRGRVLQVLLADERIQTDVMGGSILLRRCE